MNKILKLSIIGFLILVCALLTVPVDYSTCVFASNISDKSSGLKLKSSGAILIDKESGKVLYEDNADAKLPVASMTKTMTLLLTFEAIDRGEISLDNIVPVSSYAASQEGSECFLEPGQNYMLYDLVKAVVVASANDACVAIAEFQAGTDELFAKKMNDRASELGLTNTCFKNSTGLHEDGHYSSARDISKIMSKLVEHDEYMSLAKIWMDKISHIKGRVTELTNTNKLLKMYKECDAGKTGYTDEARYCLTATAKRGDMRLISCVVGERSATDRFDDTIKLFNFGFSNYAVERIMEKDVALTEIAIKKSNGDKVPVYLERDVLLLSKKSQPLNVTTNMVLYDNLSAPLEAGVQVGTLEIYDNGVQVDSVNIIIKESVVKKTFLDELKKVANEFKSIV